MIWGEWIEPVSKKISLLLDIVVMGGGMGNKKNQRCLCSKFKKWNKIKKNLHIFSSLNQPKIKEICKNT